MKDDLSTVLESWDWFGHGRGDGYTVAPWSSVDVVRARAISATASAPWAAASLCNRLALVIRQVVQSGRIRYAKSANELFDQARSRWRLIFPSQVSGSLLIMGGPRNSDLRSLYKRGLTLHFRLCFSFYHARSEMTTPRRKPWDMDEKGAVSEEDSFSRWGREREARPCESSMPSTIADACPRHPAADGLDPCQRLRSRGPTSAS